MKKKCVYCDGEGCNMVSTEDPQHPLKAERICAAVEKYAPAELDLVGGYFYKDGPVWHTAEYLKSL